MTLTVPKTSSISVIIPTFNEQAKLPVLLESLRGYPGLEIIVADGGSRDATPSIAKDFGARLISSRKGRCFQLNTGAGIAAGEVLLFLHCDTLLPEHFNDHLHAVLDIPGTAAGAFHLHIRAHGLGFRLIERGANLRSRLAQLPYGDQAFFVRRDMFDRVGGFPEFPVMEDIGLVRRLKKLGRIRLAPAAVSTSARRWRKFGLIRTTCLHQLLLLGLLLGTDLERLRRIYLRQENTPADGTQS